MKRLNLMLHAGGEAVELPALANVRTPAATETWTPVPHSAFVEQVRKGLENANLEIVTEQHALAKGGDRYFGLMQIAKRGMTARDHSLVVGLRNTHDKRFPAGLCAGSGVFVCDNLAFSSEVVVGRKHTVNIFRDLPAKITQAIAMLNGKWANQEKRFDAYKETGIDKPAHVHDLLVRAFKGGAMPATYLPHILGEWENPRHDAFKPRNAWSLFNAFTEVYKKTNVAELPARSEKLHLLLDEHCGVSLDKLEPVEVGAN